MSTTFIMENFALRADFLHYVVCTTCRSCPLKSLWLEHALIIPRLRSGCLMQIRLSSGRPSVQINKK